MSFAEKSGLSQILGYHKNARFVFAQTRTMRGLLVYDAISFLAFFSPPFFCFFVWRNFLKSENQSDRPAWKTRIDWLALICTTTFFLVCLLAAIFIPQDVAKDNWASVATWRNFAAWVIRIAPVFLILALCGRRKTRLLSFLWIVAVVIDCIAVDMMA